MNNMVSFGLSDIGRKRKNNQDFFGIEKIAENAELCIVCDGMGGANGGNIASKMAVEVFTDFVKNTLNKFINKETNTLVLPKILSEGLDDGLDTATAEFFMDTGVTTSDFLMSESKTDEIPTENDSVEKEYEYPSEDADDSDFISAEEKTSENENDLYDILSAYPEVILRNAAYEANKEVNNKASEDSSLAGMGTTLVAVLIIDNRCFYANVGDSRIYLMRDNSLKQLTHDHSLVQYLVDIGQITPEEALTHYARNVITKAVGSEEELEADTDSFALEEGTTYLLLCSDGLTNFVQEDDIRDVVLNYDSEPTEDEEIRKELEEKVTLMINTANNNGGSDNITALLIKFIR